MMKKGEEGCLSTLVVVAALNEEEGVGPTLAEINSFLDKPFCLVVDGRARASAYYRLATLLIEKKRLRKAALVMGVLFLITVVMRIYGTITTA